MPVIPVLQENQRITPGAPVEAVSVSDAGIVGRGISALGQGVESLGDSLYNIEKVKGVKKNLKRQMDIKEGKFELEDRAQKLYDNVIRIGAADGSDYETLYKGAMDDEIKRVAEKYGDDDLTKMGVQNEGADLRNNFTRELQKQARVRFTATGKARGERAMNTLAGRTVNFPELADLKMTEFREYLSTPEMDALYSPAEKEAIFKLADKTIAEASILGYEQRGAPVGVANVVSDYDQARSLVAGKYSHLFDSSEKDKLISRISRSEEAFAAKKIKEFDRTRKEAEKLDTVTKQKNYDNLIDRLNDSASPEEKSIIDSQAEQAFRLGQIDSAQLSRYNTFRSGVAKKDNNAAYGPLLQRITKGDPAKSIMRDADKLLDAGQITPETYRKVRNDLKARNSRAKSDPTFNRDLRFHEKRLTELFGKKEFLEFDPGERRQNYVKILDEYRTAASKHGNPKKAADEIIKDRIGNSALLPMAPGVPADRQGDEKSIERELQRAEQLRRAGKLSPAEFSDRLKKLDALLKAKRAEREMKEEGKTK
jgi:hypothetical protein